MPYRVYGVYGNFEVRFSFLIRQWVDHFNSHKTAHPLATDIDIVGEMCIRDRYYIFCFLRQSMHI